MNMKIFNFHEVSGVRLPVSGFCCALFERDFVRSCYG